MLFGLKVPVLIYFAIIFHSHFISWHIKDQKFGIHIIDLPIKLICMKVKVRLSLFTL